MRRSNSHHGPLADAGDEEAFHRADEDFHAAIAAAPGESKSKDTRDLDIHEDDQFEEAQFAAWVKQASQLPGEWM